MKSVAVVLPVVPPCAKLAGVEALVLGSNDSVHVPGATGLRYRNRARDRGSLSGRRSRCAQTQNGRSEEESEATFQNDSGLWMVNDCEIGRESDKL
jgi:hypothetical protein